MSNPWRATLQLTSWVPPIVVLPLYLRAVIGAGLSAGVPGTTLGGFVELAIAPFISLVALLMLHFIAKVTFGRLKLVLIPASLSLAELAFALLLWRG